ncbi:hypothetical protein WR30_11110 [Burkholderia contaminans FFH2055]|uniref:hypothetical protein n=1 Tax=Burkholderia contaminans TaxID=488447 RepID=UPI000625A44C|nr:hypothetical protein [Burkholderia contaminans]KKL38600.1 hypothetical protein WR30_11110 [Burkholderia contaminans FFH2055]MEB4631145.1 hypothetical protein [Burkholderia contaminans]MEB4638007.1 hypothetical protein [Burkholderia contaminans]MEB4653091.1 hypothetical protein [Burkholderia contaminans]MEB4658127.1 hypothetical protein [Burkholderia contaminans]
MKAKSKLTINGLIGAMKPGIRYSAHDLARRVKHPVSSVRQLLSLDVALARLDCHSESRGRMYSLAGTSRSPGTHVDTRIRPDFTSNLSGYMAEINTRQALAMTTRGVR